MVLEAVILAGGLGSRLGEIAGAVPKAMVPVPQRAFLEYLLDYLREQGIRRTVLAVGHKRQKIMDHFQDRYKDVSIEYSIEEQPLGTGGAIKKALGLIRGENAIVLNGDTLFKISLKKLSCLHESANGSLTMALKKMDTGDRYGAVSIRGDNSIAGFREKNGIGQCLINGGIYIIKKDLLNKTVVSDKFSFEKEFLEQYFKVKELRFLGMPFDDYFIDIGVPGDYERACRELGG